MPEPLVGIRILVVEDDEDSRDVLAQIVTFEGGRVCVAAAQA
jgi:hypothetical protein